MASLLFLCFWQHGGKGWQCYDTQFRQHQAAGSHYQWSETPGIPNVIYSVLGGTQSHLPVTSALGLTIRQRSAPWHSLSPKLLPALTIPGKGALSLTQRRRCAKSSTEVPATNSPCKYKHMCSSCGGDHPCSGCKGKSKKVLPPACPDTQGR